MRVAAREIGGNGNCSHLRETPLVGCFTWNISQPTEFLDRQDQPTAHSQALRAQAPDSSPAQR